MDKGHYETAHPDLRKRLRANAILPEDLKAEMPEVYRLWRTCKRWNHLYWPGGIANQPHILMLEFAICEKTKDDFDVYLSQMLPKLRQ